jgi:hypothetical protein
MTAENLSLVKIGIFSVCIVFLAAGALYVAMFVSLFAGACANTVWQKAANPEVQTTAFFFERNCGATTGFSTQLSIVRGDELPDEGGNVLVIDGYFDEMKIEWKGADMLVVSNVPANARVFRRVKAIDGVTVEYLPTSSDGSVESDQKGQRGVPRTGSAILINPNGPRPRTCPCRHSQPSASKSIRKGPLPSPA